MQPQPYPPQPQYAQPQYAQPNQQYGSGGVAIGPIGPASVPPQGYYQPPQYAPQPQPAPQAETFGDPAAKIDRPRWDTLYGRLLIIEPLGIERNVVNELGRADPSTQQKPRQDRMTMNVTILDGPPFTYGGRPNDRPPIADHLQAEVPCEFRMLSSHKLVLNQCEWALPAPGAATGGKVLARLGVSDREPRAGESRSYRLQPATDADKALAAQYTAWKANQALGVPQQATPQPMVQQAPAAWMATGPPAGEQTNYPPSQQYAQQAPPAAAMVQAPVLDIDTPPTGMSSEVWATLNPEQRTAIAQSAAARPPY